MFEGIKREMLRVTIGALAVAVVTGGALLAWPTPAQAHCDSVNGPVVSAARQALEAGDVNLVLPYVKPEAETELTAVFKHSLEVRRLGGEAEHLSDRFFYETAVRLHRAGEGAPYTGLKPAADPGPALAAADKALEDGSLSGLYPLLDDVVKHGVEKKYHAVVEARERAAREGTVAAARERAEAELIFEKYVFELYEAARGEKVHAEGAAPTEHAH